MPKAQDGRIAQNRPETVAVSDTYSTIEVARMLGMAVRSVQMMVDRGELQAWKTPGGHRRILRESVERWRAERGVDAGAAPRPAREGGLRSGPAASAGRADAPCVLIIEDSKHYQNLLTTVIRQHMPDVNLHVADDGIVGLAMAGRLQPQVLVVDILLPGIDGATLINGLRLHPQFSSSRLLVVTSLDEGQREPYAFALEGVPVVHKPGLVAELPPLLRRMLDEQPEAVA